MSYDSWPEYCYVPAMVDDVMRSFGIPSIEPKRLALALGVRAPEEAPNPLQLPTMGPAKTRPSAAVREFVDLWPSLSIPGSELLRFHFQSASSVSPMYLPDTLTALLQGGSYVGAGVDYDYLYGDGGSERLHIVRIEGVHSAGVSYVDPTNPRFETQELAFKLFREGMMWASNGLWIFDLIK